MQAGRIQKAHRPAPFAGRREVAGYENPGEGFASHGGRPRRGSNWWPPEGETPSSRRGIFGPPRPSQLGHDLLGGALILTGGDLIHKGPAPGRCTACE
jgi:hypothetical protein